MGGPPVRGNMMLLITMVSTILSHAIWYAPRRRARALLGGLTTSQSMSGGLAWLCTRCTQTNPVEVDRCTNRRCQLALARQALVKVAHLSRTRRAP